MQPIKHPMCNDVLRKPPGMTEEECRDLHIRRDDASVWSFWQPNPEELLALNRGGAVALIVMGVTHPPLMVMATHPTEPQDMRPADPDEYQHRMAAVNARLIALTKLLKKALAEWVANPTRREGRDKIADQFLDLLNSNKTDGSLVDAVPADEPSGITQADLDRYRADAEGWKAEAESMQRQLREISEALGDEWNVIKPVEAITALRNRLAAAEMVRDDWERTAKERVDPAEYRKELLDRIEAALGLKNPNPTES